VLIDRIRFAINRELSVYWIVRSKGILHFINSEKSDCILDVGCSSGQWSFSVAPRARFVVGIDLDAASIYKAKILAEKLGFKNTSFVIASATAIPFANRSFDKIICADVMDIIPQDDKAASEMYRISKQSAIAVFTNMLKDRNHYLINHKFPEHIRNYTLEAISRLLERSSFQIIDYFYFYHPFSTLLWEFGYLFSHSWISRLPGLGFLIGLILSSLARLDRQLTRQGGGIGVVAKKSA
jgi:ubiquinone/menaquinone biosynthesis C-methylase UbiE